MKIKGKSVEIVDLQLYSSLNEMACRKGDVLGWNPSNTHVTMNAIRSFGRMRVVLKVLRLVYDYVIVIEK